MLTRGSQSTASNVCRPGFPAHHQQHNDPTAGRKDVPGWGCLETLWGRWCALPGSRLRLGGLLIWLMTVPAAASSQSLVARIHDVQGIGHISPFSGQDVSGVEKTMTIERSSS